MREKVIICYAVTDNCINLLDSYGEICVRCNACGRFDESTKHQCHLDVLKRQLAEKESFRDRTEGWGELQRKNYAANIEYMKNEIRKVEEILARKGER
ncbi:hypothetical protein M0R72_18330 [Candidatus Pacearchaeota archaeon]|jgi:hypothetical protein|nr:hypothetical protein [Candidatus Pacearchaeota archaeon]